MSGWRALPPLLLAVLALAGCEGVQSALEPQGPEAARIALLAEVLFVGAGAILLLVVVLTAIAVYAPEARRRWLARHRVVVIGGILFPGVTVSVLLVYGLLLMGAGEADPGRATGAGAEGGGSGEPIRIAVVGEQWWWRVVYQEADGYRFETANEIRIPVGRTVELELTTADVIHSFWVPKLAGKLDMIPGRTNRLRLAADRPGVSRGQCAEYCGGAHALMAFEVVALSETDFAEWLELTAGPAPEPEGEQERRGRKLFLAAGCGGCHTVRGTPAAGTIGPDLTHVGGRLSLAAAILPNSPEAFASWIVDNQHIKPDNRMPPYGIFGDAEVEAIAAYLASLR
ncbi:MAG: cytochrome c oxidase subunit II [Tistlia sp.]|uniref:cytochrome c oxidase subunit II n=1 Tax=Tistlia sp. TaxID=3057121 RepID=UPI0034A34C3C